jgi:type II secretory pathway component PulF
MYKSMGVELPALTRFVLVAYRWVYPPIFLGAATLLIAKQFFVREKWASLAITMAVVFAVDFMGSEIVQALYRPLLDLTEKLSK